MEKRECYYAVEVAPYHLHLYNTVSLARHYCKGDRTKYIGQVLRSNFEIMKNKGFLLTIPEYQYKD